MAFKTFLDYYVPYEDSVFQLVDLPEDLYQHLEKKTGVMPGMRLQCESFDERGICVILSEYKDGPPGVCSQKISQVFLSWPVVEPVSKKEREEFRIAMSNYAEYNNWLETAVKPCMAN
jgi:hypothetical protein